MQYLYWSDLKVDRVVKSDTINSFLLFESIVNMHKKHEIQDYIHN